MNLIMRRFLVTSVLILIIAMLCGCSNTKDVNSDIPDGQIFIYGEVHERKEIMEKGINYMNTTVKIFIQLI